MNRSQKKLVTVYFNRDESEPDTIMRKQVSITYKYLKMIQVIKHANQQTSQTPAEHTCQTPPEHTSKTPAEQPSQTAATNQQTPQHTPTKGPSPKKTVASNKKTSQKSPATKKNRRKETIIELDE